LQVNKTTMSDILKSLSALESAAEKNFGDGGGGDDDRSFYIVASTAKAVAKEVETERLEMQRQVEEIKKFLAQWKKDKEVSSISSTNI